MRYMVFVKMAEDIGEAPAALQEAMGQDMENAFAAGSLLQIGGLYGTVDSTEIRLAGGEILTTDGPYAEAKEVVGGYAIIDVRSHDEAVLNARRVIELHQEFWPGWEGSAEVRRLVGLEEMSPQPA
jgi:hypothetical protein